MLPVLIAFWMTTPGATGAHQDGVQQYKAHKYTEAIAAFETAVKDEKPDTPEYRESVLLIGQSYFMLGQATAAIPWLEKLTSVNEANYMLGFAYLQSGQAQPAQAAFARLFGVQPDSASAHLVTAQMLLRAAYEDRALAEASQAVETDPNLPGAHFVLAEAELAKGSPESAIADLTKELTIDPTFAMAWYQLGDAKVRLRRWKDAIADVQRSIWLNPDFSGAFILLGRCFYETGDFSNAEGTLRKALTLEPENRPANYYLGRSLIAEGRSQEGTAILEKLKSAPQLAPASK